MSRKLKRVLALMLTLVMLLGMMNLPAAATGIEINEPSDVQVINAGGTTDGTNVTISKTIDGTDEENVFDITLDVTTTEDLSGKTLTTAPDAAISLVVDVSRTMAFKYINGNSCQEKDLNSRLNVAKRVMLNFLAEYAASGIDEDGNQIAHRWVNLIGFGGQAWNYLYGHENWVDVATDEGMAVMEGILRPVKSGEVGKKTTGAVLGSGNKYLDWSGTIAGEKIDWTNGHGNGGTNIEAGLMLAKNVWAAGGKIDEVDQAHRWTVMLSDGEPTMYVNPSNSKTDINSTAYIYGLSASSSATINKTDYEDVPDEAAAVRSASTFEIIAMGNDKWMNSKAKWDLVNNTTCGAWLKTLSTSNTINTPGSTEESLQAVFDGLNGSIARELSYMSTEAWKVTDTMGANMEFLGFYTKDGSYHAAAELGGEGENSVAFAGNTLNWDLKISPNTNGKYSVTYRVRLMSEKDGVVPGTAYDTNASATLSYQNKTVRGYSDLKTLDFKVPSVKALAAELSFLKLDAKGNALEGAEFSLMHSADCACGKSFTSAAGYSVTGNAHSFTNILSAHTYTLAESKVPAGYVNEEGNRTFTVSFGEIKDITPVFTQDADGNYVVRNTYREDILEGSKTSELVERTENRWEIRVTVPAPAEEITVHDEVIVMVDGSYSGDSVWPQTKEAILQVGESVLNDLGTTQLTLMTFGMSDNIVLESVATLAELESKLGSLPGSLLYGRSSTNCEAGFTGIQEYIESKGDSLGSVQVIYISDGAINTDETPFTYGDFTTYTWLPNKAGDLQTLLQASLEYSLYYGAEAAATAEVFGSTEGAKAAFDAYMTSKAALADSETTMSEADLAAHTATVNAFEANVEKWGAAVFADVYAAAGLTVGEAYPISVVEDLFVDYDNANGTYIQEVFYYTSYGRPYPDRWSRTPAAATALAAMSKVDHLYMVDNNAASGWMNPEYSDDASVSVQGENVSFTYNANVTNLPSALKEILKEVSKTSISEVYVTDYMSKWANLDQDTIKIVDNTSGETIWTKAEGWLITEDIPTSKNPPVVVELVDPADYEDGGEDVMGNTSGDIYKITWNVTDTLLRSDNYSLVYEVITDVKEESFEYNVYLPSNGSTDVHYKDSTGDEQSRPIEVPEIDGVETEVKFYANPYFTVDENGDPTETLADSSHKTIEDGAIDMSKDIVQNVEFENGYDVTLNVSSTVDFSEIEISPDSAVVLVIDTSGSMQYGLDGGGWCHNANCARYGQEAVGCSWTHRWAIDPETGENTTRYKLAADGLAGFLNDYEDGSDGKRMLSIAYFGESGVDVLDWVDLNEGDNLATAQSKVTYEALSAKPRTNTAQGTGLARAIEYLNDDAVKDIENRYVILVTDGRPENTPSGGVATAKENETGTHGAAVAAQLESECGAVVQVIGFSTGSITMRQGDRTVNDWLMNDVATTPADFCSAESFADFDLGLSTFYEKIAEGMSLYSITDPMGEYIDFAGLKEANSAVVYDEAAETLKWDLKAETPVATTNEDGTVTYTYSLTYTVLLDTEKEGFAWDTLYPANKATSLTYVALEDISADGTISPDAEIKNAWFNIPGVYAKIFEKGKSE